MWRLVLRVAVGLVCLHAVATVIAGQVLHPHDELNALRFTMAVFGYLFLAAVNLVVWQAPVRGPRTRFGLHACNVAFLLFTSALADLNPEPPLITGAVRVGLLAAASFGLEAAVRAQSRAALARLELTSARAS